VVDIIQTHTKGLHEWEYDREDSQHIIAKVSDVAREQCGMREAHHFGVLTKNVKSEHLGLKFQYQHPPVLTSPLLHSDFTYITITVYTMPPPPPPPPQGGRKPTSAEAKSTNEYIPSFISKKPFYVVDDETSSSAATANDYLEHQRLQTSSSQAAAKWYDRGKKAGPAATKYRKGACENCGAMTHKTKECLSRPRKAGAKWTGRDIQADEVVQDVNMGWDAKRDRWNGYDASEYANVVEEYNALEDLKNGLGGGEKGEEGKEEDGTDGAKYEEETDMGRQQSTSTRQLRLREDTAKYLLNLDLDSAKYDPKTRSMVDAGANEDASAALVAEEGFVRTSGAAGEFEEAQRYAWEQQQRGDKNALHLQANPTQGEFSRKKEKEAADAKREALQKTLAEKYGGQEHLKKDPLRDAAIVENERFVEYDERGLIKGAPKPKVKCMYAEDVMNNNHTSVWGSWWRDFKWGYACCHATIKNSYCTGEDGRKALEAADRLKEEAEADSEEVPKQIAWEEEAKQEEHVPNAVESDSKPKVNATARKRALEEAEEKEMEEYRRKRVDASDPMAKMLGRDELVH
jgi:pre-mRNA-processing factor SLU7